MQTQVQLPVSFGVFQQVISAAEKMFVTPFLAGLAFDELRTPEDWVKLGEKMAFSGVYYDASKEWIILNPHSKQNRKTFQIAPIDENLPYPRVSWDFEFQYTHPRFPLFLNWLFSGGRPFSASSEFRSKYNFALDDKTEPWHHRVAICAATPGAVILLEGERYTVGLVPEALTPDDVRQVTSDKPGTVPKIVSVGYLLEHALPAYVAVEKERK